MKFELYLILFKFFTAKSCHKVKKVVFLILKKKRKTYLLSVFLKKGLLMTISTGNILNYFNISTKYLKKTKKGFTMFLNTFLKIFNRFKPKFFLKNVVINFFNFYLIFFFKKLTYIFEKRHGARILFNFNNTSLTNLKKNKGIKKRLKKRFLKNFLLHWSSINFEKNQETRFKVKNSN